MKERKHIDRLYQEKFRDFEAMPDEKVWKSISAKLRESDHKKHSISPLWTRMAGVAAIFAILILIGDWIFPSSTRSAVVNKEIKEDLGNNTSSIADNSKLIPLQRIGEPAPLILKPREELMSENIHSTQNTVLESSHLEKKKITSRTNHLPAKTETGLTSKGNEASGLQRDLLPQPIEEERIASESSRGSFEVKTHAAPIYQGNFGKGSFLDPRFSDKGGEAEITYSYGINIAYHVSDKIKIRSGVNKVNMSYNTSGVAYQAVVGPVDIKGVAFSNSDIGSETSAKIPTAYNERSTVGSLYTGMLNQKMGFIEVPVELEYNLIKKRFELNIIGGASTLFLDENEVSLYANSVSAYGKAKNLKDISFSTNIGLGLDYNLSERFKLNFEPMLKYQLNTFDSNSAENRPYYFGIYSGFSYKF